MTGVHWSGDAHRDLVRLYEFLAPLNERAAREAVREILGGIDRIVYSPRIGRSLDAYRPRDIRRLVVGVYELRYEVRGPEIIIVRLFHGREDREIGSSE